MDLSPYVEILKAIGLGAFYGAQASIYQYMASEDLPLSWSSIITKAFWEKFNWYKFAKFVLVGSLVGAITVGYGLITPGQWDIFTQATGLPQIPMALVLNLVNVGVVMVLDRVTKLIVRRTPLATAWDGLKAKVLKLLEAQAAAKKAIEEASKPTQ